MGVKKIVYKQSETKAPLCKCGCGQRTKWNERFKKFNIYLNRHQNRGKNNPMYSKPRSEETKRKIRDGNKDKYVSLKTRRKLSIINEGKHFSPKTEFKKGNQIGYRFKKGHIPWNKDKHGYTVKQRIINGIEVSYGDIHRNIIIPTKIDENSAELLGIFSGDGNLYKYKNKKGHLSKITIYGNPKERSYIDNCVIPLFKKVFNISPKGMFFKNGCYSALIHSKGIGYFLVKYGFSFGKKGNFGIPKEIKKDPLLMNAYIRGLFDTDGCLLFVKKRKKIIPCIRFQFKGDKIITDLKEYLCTHFKCYYKLNVNRKDKKRGFSYIYSKLYCDYIDLNKWFNLIGMNNKKNLLKYQKWSKSIRGDD